MNKFKVGDLVKIVKPNTCTGKEEYINQIHKIIRDEKEEFDVDQWWKLDDNSCFRWNEDELELVKGPTIKTAKVKIESNGITLCGIKQMKEGNEMIESINLIDLYEKKISDKISKEANEQIATIRNKNSLENKMIEIVEKATNELNELYLSQLSEEQKDDLSKGKYINQDNFSLVMQEPIRLITDGSLLSNNLFYNEEIETIKKETDNKLNGLHENVRIIKAHVGIAKTKEEVEEILTRYGILKKGKLVID